MKLVCCINMQNLNTVFDCSVLAVWHYKLEKTFFSTESRPQSVETTAAHALSLIVMSETLWLCFTNQMKNHISTIDNTVYDEIDFLAQCTKDVYS